MSGKKYGLGEKYKALGVGKPILSINPMQDDLKKLKGMSAAIGVPSKFIQRSLTLRAGKAPVKDKIYKGVLKTHNAIKDAVTSKAGIGATGSAVGYELGKLKGKVNKKMYGGAMKVQKANVGLLIKGMKVTPKLIKKFFSKTGDYPMSLKNTKSPFVGIPKEAKDRVLGKASAKDAKELNKFYTTVGSYPATSTLKTSAKDKVKKAIKETVTSKTGIGATGVAVGYELGKAKGKRYGGAMKKMKIGGAAIKGKGAVVGGSGLQDEKLKPGKTLSVKQKKIASKAPPRNKITGADFKAMKKPKKASLGLLMDAGMRNKKVMGAGALGLLSMLAKKK